MQGDLEDMPMWLSSLALRLAGDARNLGLEAKALSMQIDFVVMRLAKENAYMRRNRWRFWRKFPS